MHDSVAQPSTPVTAQAQAAVQVASARVRLFWQAFMVWLFGLFLLGNQALAQVIQEGGNNRPDTVVNSGICGSGGLLSWLTGTKLIAVMLAVGLVGYFIGRFFGRQGAQEGLVGAGIAVLGIAAVKAITAVFVAGC